MKIYISGGITGIEDYKKRFQAIEDHLRHKWGCPVSNPTKEGEIDGMTYRDYIYKDIELLKECTHIYMMKGWEHSLGARAEHAIAVATGLKIFYETEEA